MKHPFLPCARMATTLLLVAASTGHAQSNVQINGVFDMFAGQRQLSGRAKLKTVDSGGMTTSRLGFEGSEDLGDGWRANFAISGFFRGDTGESGRFGTTDAGWRRFAFVGLQSPTLGTLRLGRVGTPTFGVAIRFNPFGDSTTLAPYTLHMYPGGQPLAAPMNTLDSAADNSVAWNSPRWGGFSVAGLVSAAETSARGPRWAAGLNWSAGPFDFALATEQSEVTPLLPAGVSKLVNVQAGASYNLNVAKLFAQYGHTEMNLAVGQREYDTWQLGTSVPVGAGALLVSYASSTKQERALADVERSTLGVGYDYNLSRRTDLYTVFLNDKVKGLSAGRTLVAGVRHRF